MPDPGLWKCRKTHFVGASCSSMSPLMNVAILPAAALVSSAVLEMVNCLSRSSSTWTDFWFSALVFAALEGTESMRSTEGIVMDVRWRGLSRG